MKTTLSYCVAILISTLGLVLGQNDSWQAIHVPGNWEDQNPDWKDYDGFAWYRAFVSIPKEWEGQRLFLTIQATDNVDESFFNGEKVGANGSMPPLYGDPSSRIRRPGVIEPDQVRFGDVNLIVFRVYDKSGAGGLTKGPIQLAGGEKAIDLSGKWEWFQGDDPRHAHWPGDHPESDESVRSFQAYQERLGSEAAGYRGLVPIDQEGRKRLIEDVRKRFANNSNVHSNIEGKGKPQPPREARTLLKTTKDFVVDTVLSEPLVRQPLFSEFDERGRLWVVQYIEYPSPAGLEIIAWDQHLRAVFDTVPPPPPFNEPAKKKYRGQDKITIHEDLDGDGKMDRHQTFLSGLNIVTSTAQAKNGVWVMHPPYLLFYPDHNDDYVPDGDPILHLSGFGLEDTHSVANSLKWGPDGWLYGATGSTVTARVRTHLNPDQPVTRFFGQTIWRYHPDDYRFELFAQGGWNTFGVDFDRKGRLYSGTNGSTQAVYFVQGGYYRKGFGKHGPFNNAFTYGHFNGIPWQGDQRRLVHQWLPYDGGALPGYEDALIGPNSLANVVVAMRTKPDGSGFVSEQISLPIETEDKWFRPVHAGLGPDGAIYLSDFYDARITHVDPRDNWDREHGRIYRLRHRNGAMSQPFDLAQKSSAELVEFLRHTNQWFRETARRLLKERQDTSVLPALDQLSQGSPQEALESLWAIHLLGALTTETAGTFLEHSDPHVRAWTIRLLADRAPQFPDSLFPRLLALTELERHPVVISQLLSSIQRLKVEQGLALLKRISTKDAYASDPHIPLQFWWAWESQITKSPELALQTVLKGKLADHLLFKKEILSRLARRLVGEPNPQNLKLAAKLFKEIPGKPNRSLVLQGMSEALKGNQVYQGYEDLNQVLSEEWAFGNPSTEMIRLAMRLGSGEALVAARNALRDSQADPTSRLESMAALAELRDEASVSTFLELLSDPEEEIVLGALTALRRYSNAEIAEHILLKLPFLKGNVGKTAQSLLAGRKDWARRLLAKTKDGTLARESIDYENLLLMQKHGDDVSRSIRELWGNLRQPDEAKTKTMNRVRQILAKKKGRLEEGHNLFMQLCATCHQLNGEGQHIGPDLTGYERDNQEFLLSAIVDPNLGVREDYEMITITLRPKEEGEPAASLVGFVQSINNNSLTVRDLAGNLSTIAKKDIAKEERTPVSLMPEGLLDPLSDQAIQDLFRYLSVPVAIKSDS